MAPSTLVLIVAASLALALTLAAGGATLACTRRGRVPGARSGAALPPISILKPLKGCDEGLYENLAALVCQNYPEFELICGTEDPRDPACALVERLQAEYPRAAIALVRGASPLGWNPKVTNLASLSRAARHELWLISDANVRPGPDYLRGMAEPLGDLRVGLVTSPLAGFGERTVGALLENLHFNSFVASGVRVAHLGGQACAVGKSMLFRRADFEAVGGWAAVKDVLAEDYVLGRVLERSGWRAVLAPEPLPVLHERRTVREFVERHLRWSLMRRRLSPAYLAEPLLNPVPWLLLVSAATEGSWRTAAFLGMTVKLLLDVSLTVAVRGAALPLRALVWIPVKDVLVAAIWIAAWFKHTVRWRGHLLAVGPGSVLAPV